MPSNLEIVADGYERFVATGELPVDLYAPDFVWDMSHFAGWPEDQLYHGVEGSRAFMEAWREAWEDWVVDVESLHEAGEQVLAIMRQRGRSRSTGVSVEMNFGMLWTLRDGKQTRMEMYADPDEARCAAGLSDDNVELLRRGWDAISRGDVEEAIDLSTEDVVIIAVRSAVEGAFVGHDGVREFFADNANHFAKFQLTLNEARDLGDGRVLAIGTGHIQGRGGGVETDVPTAGIATFRDGKLSRWEDFGDRELALKAAGLES